MRLTRTLMTVTVLMFAGPALGEEPQPTLSERLCAAYGPGYQAVPGTTTCIKVSGEVQVDVIAGSVRTGPPSPPPGSNGR